LLYNYYIKIPVLKAEDNFLTSKYKKDDKGKEYKYKIDWINYLISTIDRDEKLCEDFFNSKFIIFNYDRLFEQRLWDYLNYDKCLAPDESFRFLEKMEIFHTHGYIDKIYNFEGGYTPFGSYENIDYKSIAKNIKTEREIKKEDKEKIQSYFKNCDRIFFIGFGWLQDNMRLLGLDNTPKDILRGKEIYGTAYKMSDYNIKNIENRLKLCGALQPKIINCEAVDLIRDFF